jgi:hypothetical protein
MGKRQRRTLNNEQLNIIIDRQPSAEPRMKMECFANGKTTSLQCMQKMHWDD